MASKIQGKNPFALLADEASKVIFPGKESIFKYIRGLEAYNKISKMSKDSLSMVAYYFANKEMHRSDIVTCVKKALINLEKTNSEDLAMNLQRAIYAAQSIGVESSQKSAQLKAKTISLSQEELVSLYEKALNDLIDNE